MALIFLIGARGSGKTTIGQHLAKHLQCSFHDLDHLLQQKANRTIAEIVEKEGWSGFRLQEHECLEQLLAELDKSEHHVIATGGGIVLDQKNTELMRAHGKVFWLDGSADLLFSRLTQKPEATQRPALSNLQPYAEICQTLNEREALYRSCAHYTLDASQDAKDICQNICACLHL